MRIAWLNTAAWSLAIAGATAAAAQDKTSTAAERQDVALTIYNDDLSLVHERRSVPVDNGIFKLRFEDVTAGIDPTTVHLEPEGGSLHIVEQNYEFDLISQDKLMQKYVGRDVGYRTEDGTMGTARLLSANQGYVYGLADKIVFELPGKIVLDAIPDELSPRPTLVWTLEGKGSGKRNVEINYLSRGFSWRSDYVLLLGEDERRAALTGWVTVTNQSGGTFENASLKLVAGDVNRVREQIASGRRLDEGMAYATKTVGVQEETFFEYHLYTVDRRTDLKQNQQKQILFFDAEQVGVTKAYTFRSMPHYLTRGFVVPEGSEHVNVTLRFENSEANGLGLPIPQGILRVYKRDRAGAPQFLGENRVRHTPKDETLEFEVGRAFDIVGEHVQTDYQRLGDRTFEVAFEVKLRNHKQEDITVRVLEDLYGEWKILESSLPHTKENARTAAFHVPVKKDGAANLTYRVRIEQ